MRNNYRIWFTIPLLLLLSITLPKTGSALASPSISILTPGDGSIVASPISISAEFKPGVSDMIRVTLIDQKYNQLARKLLRVNSGEADTPILFTTDLAFEIPTETTPALLTIATQDSYHRPQSLRSVTLTLGTNGQTTINPQVSSDPWLIIDEPVPLDILGGGQITVSGKIIPVNENPVRFELIKENGTTIGTAQLLVENPGEPSEFEITLSYAFVTTITDVRLVVRQPSVEFYGSNAILDSILIALTP